MIDPELAQAVILDHSRSPRRKVGDFGWAGSERFLTNPACGDELRLGVAVDEAGVVEAGFQGQGCAVSQAAASVLASTLQGMSVEEAVGLVNRYLNFLDGGEGEGLPEALLAFGLVRDNPARRVCAGLAAQALKGLLPDPRYKGAGGL